MSAEYSSFAGWEKNLKLSNNFAELIVTVGVGPRIISYRPAEGRSVFKLVNDQDGKTNEKDWKIRGGHGCGLPRRILGRMTVSAMRSTTPRHSTPSKMTLPSAFPTSSRSRRRSAGK